MKCLVKYLKGAVKGRLDVWALVSALTAQKNGIVKIIKVYNQDVVIK